ncbi:MAG: mechanosensitive ion channel [Rhodobacteraceae bacterium]|nr:mechanosensitive ion channel [Paracoccaceae bacterium]
MNGQLQGLLDSFALASSEWLSLWTLIQIAILVVLYGVAWLIARLLLPRFETAIASRNLPVRTRAILLVAVRRTRAVVFVLLAGLVTIVMQDITWPSRSFLIRTTAVLTAVWIIVYVASRVIQNRSVSRLFAGFVWLWVALDITGLLPRVLVLLDLAALQIGQMRLSLLSVGKALLILTVVLWLAALASKLVERRLQGIEDISPTMRALTAKLVSAVLFAIAIAVVIQTIGIDLSAFAFFTGAIGLGLGFGLQKVVSNLVSGVILLADRSIKPGDVISVGDTFGWIAQLGARYVSVVTRDGRSFLIPNEDLITNRVINWSFSTQTVRLEVAFGVAYDSDPHLVRQIAVAAAKTVSRVHDMPPPVCHISGFGESSIDFVLRFWINDPVNGVANVKGDVFLALWDSFRERGITIPFPQMEMRVTRAR